MHLHKTVTVPWSQLDAGPAEQYRVTQWMCRGLTFWGKANSKSAVARNALYVWYSRCAPFSCSFFLPYKELSTADWAGRGQRCVLNASPLPTLFVFTGNPIDPSRKKASAHTAGCQPQTSRC